MELPNIYENKNYKRLIVIPLALILISLFFIPTIPKGVDLKGGSLFTIYSDETADKLSQTRPVLEKSLLKFSPDVSVRLFQNPSGQGYEIEIGASENLDLAEQQISSLKNKDIILTNEIARLNFMENNEQDKAKVDEQRKTVEDLKTKMVADANALLNLLGSQRRISTSENAAGIAEEEYQNTITAKREDVMAEIRNTVSVKSYSSKEIGASLSKFFLGKTAEMILVSLLFSAILVVLLFRGKVASLAVMFGAFADIMITAGVMGFLQIPLSLATLVTLLLLIGFSIDTDMLLTIRALKRTEGEARERIYDAMGTAITMNISAISAFGVLMFVGYYLGIETYFQIGAVAMIGGFIDFIATWCGNAVLVLWYTEIKQRN